MRVYQRKFNQDGTLNPQFKPDTRKGRSGKSGKRSRRGQRLSKWARAHFIAWDSEGADVDGAHECIALLNSEGDELIEPEGIGTLDALELLVESLSRHKGALHVGFVFSYDTNMILRDLPRERVAELWKIGHTRFRARNALWTLRYRPRKEFSITREYRGEKKRGGVIWDVFGFFQSSFVEALKSYGAPAELITRIKAMKDQRPTFTLDRLKEIVDYCREECVELAGLMRKVRDYLAEAELQVSRWDGAGAVAAALLKRENVRAHKGELPAAIRNAAQHAYYGGRIELMHYGHTRARIFESDIRSAYPAAAAQLPCLSCGEWQADDCLSDMTVCRVRWNLPPALFYPFPWRAKSDGNVYFPAQGEGWYWLPEIRAAMASWGPGNFDLTESWTYTTACAHRPFAFVPALYKQRAEWKAKKIGAEKMLKLGLNSLYGKLAQRVGHMGLPPYYQLAWAGWITSYTRAALHDAAIAVQQRGGRVISFATDALYSDLRPELPESENLGDWEIVAHKGGTFVQSGVYWCGQEKVKGRGFDAETLERAGILAAWKTGQTVYSARLTRFIGMGRALIGPNWWPRWRTWHREKRDLKLTPQGKRAHFPRSDFRARVDEPWRALVPTQATLPDFEFAEQGMLSAPTDPPAIKGIANALAQALRSEYECEEQ